MVIEFMMVVVLVEVNDGTVEMNCGSLAAMVI
jgi:hypothetical protein